MGGGALSDLYKSKNKDMVNVLELDFFYLYKTKSMVSQIQIFPDVCILSSAYLAIDTVVPLGPLVCISVKFASWVDRFLFEMRFNLVRNVLLRWEIIFMLNLDKSFDDLTSLGGNIIPPGLQSLSDLSKNGACEFFS